MKEEKNSMIMIALVIGFIVVSMLYALKSAPDITVADQEQRETITVSETVEQETMPDEAYVYIEIESRGDTAQEAKEENAKVSDAVLDALYESGIDKESVETSSYYLDEERKWDKDTMEYIITGYTLTNTLKVTTSDVEGVGSIIDTAVDAGATGVNSVQFSLSRSKESEIKGEVLALAAEKAKTKAENIVDAIDVDLGELVSISETSYYNPYPWYARSAGYDMAVMEEKSYETSISPQELTVSATVTLTYEIVQ
ncbi:SIMPL domain-containing protein [Candidatus Woesearchaeota archaeon]|nr:SIMPL domain-containing protein [Candidatus Woesearchaeota archaeon]